MNLNSKIKWIERHQDKLMIALYLIFILFIGTRCRVKKDVTKVTEATNTEVRATETATSVTTTEGTLETKADSTQAEFKIEDKPVTVVTNLPGIVTETTFDPKTKTVKTKTVQKPQEIPVKITNTTTTQRTSTATSSHEKKSTETHKETSNSFIDKLGTFFFWLIVLILIILIIRFKAWRIFN